MIRSLLCLFLCLAGAAAEEPDLRSPGTRDLGFKVGKHRRTLRLHVPETRDRGALPLVIVLHGLLQSGPGIEEVSGFSGVADEEGFAVVYPNGHGARWRHRAAETDVDDVAFIREILDRLTAAGTVDAARVYVCGFSNGAFFTSRLAVELGDRIAAIGLVAGMIDPEIAEDAELPRPMPVAYFHGTADGIVTPEGGSAAGIAWMSAPEMAAWWAERNGCPDHGDPRTLKDREDDGTRVVRTVWPAAKGGAEVRFYSVEGGGHTWPGGEMRLGAIVGRTCNDLCASRTLWKFFSRHSLPPPAGK